MFEHCYQYIAYISVFDKVRRDGKGTVRLCLKPTQYQSTLITKGWSRALPIADNTVHSATEILVRDIAKAGCATGTTGSAASRSPRLARHENRLKKRYCCAGGKSGLFGL